MGSATLTRDLCGEPPLAAWSFSPQITGKPFGGLSAAHFGALMTDRLFQRRPRHCLFPIVGSFDAVEGPDFLEDTVALVVAVAAASVSVLFGAGRCCSWLFSTSRGANAQRWRPHTASEGNHVR